MATNELLLRDFKPRSALATEDHTPQRARFPVVDVHNHLRHTSGDPSTLISLMDELNIRRVVDLDGGWGEQLQWLIESQLRIMERHPHTTFISAHVLSYSENLRYVAQALGKYPNLYVDIGARIGELGRQPYTSRWFLTRYADRCLFGTDARPNQRTYQIYFRCLETADEYFDYGSSQGRYRIYGLYLPDEALRKIYGGNACRLIPGLTYPDQKENDVDVEQ